MFLTCFLVIFISKKTSTWSLSKVHKLLTVIMFIMLAYDPAYWIWEVNKFGGIDLATSLPLYICSLYWFMLPFALFAPNKIIKQMALANLATVGMIGGIFGLIFNVYLNSYGFFEFVPMRSLTYHFFMVLTSTLLWTTGYYKPTSKDRLLSLIPLYVLLGVCIKLNGIFGWDYCYTNGGIGTPLEVLSGRMPMPSFLVLLYGLGSILINLIFYRKYFKNNSIENNDYSFTN